MVRPSNRLQNAFHIGQVLIKKYGLKTLFLLFNIWEIEKKIEVLSPSDQANPFAYSCSFTLHTLYKMTCLFNGGNVLKILKNKLL